MAACTRVRTVAIGVATLIATVCLQAISTTPASAAPPTCNGYAARTSDNGNRFYVPVYRIAGSDIPPSFSCLLRQGNNNNSGVRILQRTLHDVYRRNIAVDGDFGPQTKAALAYVQANHNPPITADGIYGPQTRDSLCWDLVEVAGCAWFDGNP
jgi:peptidoglycan hydrolase-like protein with peptidoglycan-binding domain